MRSTHGQDGEQVDPQGALQMAAQRAASVTGAHGAAIAVGDASGMCCCASFGNAPDVGAPVSSTAGLTGICLRTSKLVHCDDTETDPRVDAVACRQLDLRSVLIVPVLINGSLRALIEVFSSEPHAFDARHKQELARVADSLASLLAERDSQPVVSVGGSTAEKTTPPTQVEAAARPADIAPPAVPRSSASAKVTLVPKTSPAAVAAELRMAPTTAKVSPGAKETAAEPMAPSSLPWRSLSAASKAGIIAVSLVFLLALVWYLAGRGRTSAPVAMNAGPYAQKKAASAPAGPEITFDQSPLSVTALEGPAQGAGQTSQLTPGKLIRRVEPTYPPSARDGGIGGSVVLTAIVGRTGTVENVRFVRGPESLADAAMEAVRQWVYEPYRRNGEPVAVQIMIIVKFTPAKRP